MSTEAYTPAPYRHAHTPYRRAGRSGLLLPPISLGFWQNFGENRDPLTLRTIVPAPFAAAVPPSALATTSDPPPPCPAPPPPRAAPPLPPEAGAAGRPAGGRATGWLSRRGPAAGGGTPRAPGGAGVATSGARSPSRSPVIRLRAASIFSRLA